MTFKTKNMKLYALLIVAIFCFSSCKKDRQEKYKTYNIEVKVADRVNYTYRSPGNKDGINMKSVPGTINVSHTFTESIEYYEGAYVSISTVDYFKDEFFEVIVTNAETGLVAAQKKEKGGLLVTWNVEQN